MMRSMTNTVEWLNFIRNAACLRKRCNLSEKSMTKLMGVGLHALNMIERGEAPPGITPDALFNMRGRFGLKSEHLLEKQFDG